MGINMKKGILKNKMYLYLTEFFAGVSVMAVELGASRLLAPYFSSSQIVWTIIIGTIMIAMALGNIYGGKAADKDPNPDKLYRRIVIAALWIAAIPVLGKYVILLVSGLLIFTVNHNFLVVAAFVTCMIIFVFPLFLLGTVTPSLVKYTVDSLDDNGKTVGTLGAFNTIGSIIGTFLPTFVTIPAVGTSITFLIFAGILLALAIVYFISVKRKKIMVVSAILIFVFCCVFGHNSSFAFWEKQLTYEGESIYNYLQVKEDEERIVFSTNVLFGVQSVYEKQSNPTKWYYDYAMMAPYMANVHEKESFDVLVLGMGTGTYARLCDQFFAHAEVEGVEIDGKITRLAREYFTLPENIKVTTYDGRAYLQAVDKKYDVIMVDAYQDITIPFQMATQEFFTMVKQHLVEDGVMVVNMNMRGNQDGNINQYLSDTIASVFSNVQVADVTGFTNRQLFASNNPDMRKALYRNARQEKTGELRGLIWEVKDSLREYERGQYCMTDDNAPVELLSMQMLDEVIRDEVSYYKEVYDEKGIQGLMDELL